MPRRAAEPRLREDVAVGQPAGAALATSAVGRGLRSIDRPSVEIEAHPARGSAAATGARVTSTLLQAVTPRRIAPPGNLRRPAEERARNHDF